MKFLLLVVSAMLFFQDISAQNQDSVQLGAPVLRSEHTRVSMVLYAGLNTVYANNARLSPYKSSVGISPMFGICGDFVFNTRWAMYAGLGWIGYNGKYLKRTEVSQSHDTVFHNYEILSEEGYVTVPFIFQYFIAKKYTILGGIRFSGHTHSEEEYVKGYVHNQTDFEQEAQYSKNDYSGPYHHFDIGLMAGMEWKVSKRIGISALYNFGLIPIIPGLTESSATGGFVLEPPLAGRYNRSLSMSVNYNFMVSPE